MVLFVRAVLFFDKSDMLNIFVDYIKIIVYTISRWRKCAMTISEQIKILCVRCNLSEAELARRLGKSPQSFNAKMKRGSFTIADLDEIADAAGVVFERSFVMMNGDRI